MSEKEGCCALKKRAVRIDASCDRCGEILRRLELRSAEVEADAQRRIDAAEREVAKLHAWADKLEARYRRARWGFVIAASVIGLAWAAWSSLITKLIGG